MSVQKKHNTLLKSENKRKNVFSNTRATGTPCSEKKW